MPAMPSAGDRERPLSNLSRIKKLPFEIVEHIEYPLGVKDLSAEVAKTQGFQAGPPLSRGPSRRCQTPDPGTL